MATVLTIEEVESGDAFAEFVASICETIVRLELRDGRDLDALFVRLIALNEAAHHRTIALSFLHVLHFLSSIPIIHPSPSSPPSSPS
jgi:hypothetical protein